MTVVPSGQRLVDHLIARVKAFCASRGLEAFLVGGLVRDHLAGLPTRDVDLAVRVPSLAGADLFDLAGQLAQSAFPGEATFVPLDQVHGVARVVVSTGGQRWYVDLSGFSDDIASDLARRDFTVDALGLPLDAWGAPDWPSRLVDPFGGLRDLEGRLIRALSDSVFRDDPVRLLRAVRLAARLGFAIEPQTRRLVVRDAHLLPTVAQERVRDELLLILALEGAKEHLLLADQLGLLGRVFPELEPTKGVVQPKEHHWDVFGHLLECVAAAERVTRPGDDPVLALVPWDGQMEAYFDAEASDGHTRRTLLKLAALLHDIAKPQTKTIEPSTGRMRFFGHSELGAAMARQALGRLRFSARGIRMVSTMVEHHLRPAQMGQGTELPTRRAVYRYFRDLGEVAVDTLYLSLADYLAARGPAISIQDWELHVRIVRHTLELGLKEEAAPRQSWLVNGHDLMQAFHLLPGPELGSVLEAVHEAQAAGEVTTREEALAWVERYLAQGKPE